METSSLWHKVIRSKFEEAANEWDANLLVRSSSRSPWKDISLGLLVVLVGSFLEH